MGDVRPFVFDHLELSKVQPRLDTWDLKQIEDYLIHKVEQMLDTIKDYKNKEHPELNMPLVRLKIENTGYAVIKSKKINDHFINRIANQ